MRLFALICILIEIFLINGDDFEKYAPLREQCQRTPTNSECLQLKAKFFDLIKKCQTISSPTQFTLCQQVKSKLCSIFPSVCGQTSTTKKQTTKSKLIKITDKSTIKPKSIKSTSPSPITTKTTAKVIITSKLITTSKTTTTTVTSKTPLSDSLSNEEFVKVPVDPEELRTRGAYCIRHGKEKKCQDLLNNLKTTYSSCTKKKPTTPVTKPEQLDCHSFQSHLCKAFPKFPPCIKQNTNAN